MQDIASLLRASASKYGERPALETETGESISYARLLDEVTYFGNSLKSADLTSKRDRPRIGIVLGNGTDFAVSLLGLTTVAEAAPFNPNCTLSEFDAYFQRAAIDALLVAEDESGPAVSIAENRNIPLFRLTPKRRIIGFEPSEERLPDVDGNAAALVLMTSGSTGASKLVPLSHRNVCTSAAAVCQSMSLGPDDRCLSMWEQYHIGGLVDLLLAPLFSGGCVIQTSGFNAERFFELLRDRKPTWYQAVPTTLNELVLFAERENLTCKPNSLRLIRSVAAALAPALMQRAEELFGVPVIQTFGMTEAGPLITSTALPPAFRKPGSVGRSCGTEIRIVDEHDTLLPVSISGEVEICGPNVFSGYEDDEEANRKAFRSGWFRTGDTGYLDQDGDLFLTGRIKQLINRGGEKINSQEVDDVLLTHEAVLEAASFAVKHKTLGEDIAAAVVAREGVSVDELRAYLATRLSAFKIPGRIFLLDQLPRNPVGKIDRLALSNLVESTQAQTGHVAPRNELERFLAKLWRLELRAFTVGIHDDFSALGGDSLSSIRILSALEEALDGPVPDEIFLRFATIADLAEALEGHGLGLKNSAEGDAHPVGTGESGAEAAWIRTMVGAVGLVEDVEGTAAKLEEVSSRKELQALHDTVSLYSTPHELDGIVKRLKKRVPGKKRHGDLSLLEAMALRRVHARWCRRIRSEIGTPAQTPSWKRSRISESAIHYAGGEANPPGKTLLVGFAGNYMRLMTPTYRVLNSLDPASTDLLLLVDFQRKLFLGGMEGIGADIDEISTFINDFAKRPDYGRVVSLGTSGGSLAAIYSAIRFDWAKAIAVGPALLSRHSEFAEILKTLALEKPQLNTTLVVETSNVARDLDASNQLKHLFPSLSVHIDKRFTDHNLINERYKRGELPQFFDAVIT